MRARLREHGVEARLEAFRSYETFAKPYGLLIGLALAAGRPAPPPAAAALAALASRRRSGAALEGEFRTVSPGALFARRTSQNLVAEVEPAGEPRRTLCLVSHIDSSRSGLIFDPRADPAPRRRRGGVRACLRRLRGGAAALALAGPAGWSCGAARALLALAGALLAEREIRGVDVAGANDNASGAAATAVLAAECAARPLREHPPGAADHRQRGGERDRVARLPRRPRHLAAGCSSTSTASGRLRRSTTCAARAGRCGSWESDPGLRAVAERVSESRPDLGLSRDRAQLRPSL